jgi:hypothetical protein
MFATFEAIVAPVLFASSQSAKAGEAEENEVRRTAIIAKLNFIFATPWGLNKMSIGFKCCNLVAGMAMAENGSFISH